MALVRQGDVLFVPINKIPEEAVLEKTRTVAYGEVTGHSHDLVGVAEVYSLGDQLFALVGGATKVVHQEHDTIAVEKGLYEIRIQREYIPQSSRRVLD